MRWLRTRGARERWRLAAGCALAFALTSCAKQGADVNGQRVHSLYEVIFALALPVFVVVEALLLWYILRYRKRDDRPPPQSFGTRRALIIFFLIPTIIVAVDYVYGERTLAQVEKLDPNPQVVIRVEGFQWEWTFYYLNEGVFSTGKTLVKPALMVIPVDEPVKIELVSRDVIHSFFVPAFLFKRDVIPGRVNTFTFTANRLGNFPAQCAEFCGLWHSRMLFSVHVVNPADYLAWIKQTREAILNVSCPSSGNTLQVVAKNISWNTNCLAVNAGSSTSLTVVNDDDGIDHNFAVYNSVDRTTRFFQTGRFAGVATKSFTLQSLPPGHYYFQCDVHGPAMSGVFIVKAP
jgi:cytochrome c oxidase subunit II